MHVYKKNLKRTKHTSEPRTQGAAGTCAHPKTRAWHGAGRKGNDGPIPKAALHSKGFPAPSREGRRQGKEQASEVIKLLPPRSWDSVSQEGGLLGPKDAIPLTQPPALEGNLSNHSQSNPCRGKKSGGRSSSLCCFHFSELSLSQLSNFFLSVGLHSVSRSLPSPERTAGRGQDTRLESEPCRPHTLQGLLAPCFPSANIAAVPGLQDLRVFQHSSAFAFPLCTSVSSGYRGRSLADLQHAQPHSFQHVSSVLRTQQRKHL